tara:strand:- start:10189 stop:11721 length:1533 start_codon:yes stop_codon:yes gene_type:complete
MRERVANKTDHDPEEPAYRDQMSLLLNEAYEDVWNESVWPFTQKLVYIDMLPDLTPGRLLGQTVTTNDGQRRVTFSAPVDILTARQKWIVGNPIELHGRDYEVLQVNSTTELVLTEAVRHPAVGSPLASPDQLSGNASWKIKFRYYILPDDCLEVLYLGHRDTPITSGALTDGHKVWSVANRPEESMGLREDRTADHADIYFPIAPRIIPPGEDLTITWTENEVAAEGTFAGLTYYEFCWCLMSPDGVYGPLSNPLISQAPSNVSGSEYSPTVAFFSFDKVPFSARPASHATRGNPEPLEGLRKVLWFNSNFDHTSGQRLGEPKWLQVLTGHAPAVPNNENAQNPVSALDTEASVQFRFRNGLLPGNPRYLEFDGQHRRIRPYPRVDSFDQQYTAAAATTGTNWQQRRQDFFKRAELRYQVKPPPLRYDTDTPAMPYQFHQMIVDKALWDIFLKSDEAKLATFYEGRFEKGLKKAKDRLSKTDTAWRFGQGFGGGRGRMLGTDYRLTFEG